jgi:ribonuclease HII
MITNNYEIGVDEAGRGPLIGRVYSSAVYLGNSIPPKDIIITDSKKMTRIQRQKAYEWIINNAKDYSIAFSEPNEIDNINILQATRLAMNRALSSIKECNLYDANTIVIDGPRWENKFDEFKKYNLQIKSVIGGDSKHLSIAAASIIAKEEHDKYIKELCLQNEDLNDKYDLLNNMGYGTKKHLEGIKKYGISPFHRKSFKPCKL